MGSALYWREAAAGREGEERGVAIVEVSGVRRGTGLVIPEVAESGVVTRMSGGSMFT